MYPIHTRIWRRCLPITQATPVNPPAASARRSRAVQALDVLSRAHSAPRTVRQMLHVNRRGGSGSAGPALASLAGDDRPLRWLELVERGNAELANMPERFVLKEGREYKVGRNSHIADLVLQPEQFPKFISRLHCTLKVARRGGCSVTDARSLNGPSPHHTTQHTRFAHLHSFPLDAHRYCDRSVAFSFARLLLCVCV